ncbi:hypothetical protein [Salinicoccus sp. CNSTN-B1]
MNVNQQIEAVMGAVKEWRREMHRHPEVSFHKVWTSGYIEKALSEMGVLKYHGRLTQVSSA